MRANAATAATRREKRRIRSTPLSREACRGEILRAAGIACRDGLPEDVVARAAAAPRPQDPDPAGGDLPARLRPARLPRGRAAAHARRRRPRLLRALQVALH